jgi:hypothetical protein
MLGLRASPALCRNAVATKPMVWIVQEALVADLLGTLFSPAPRSANIAELPHYWQAGAAYGSRKSLRSLGFHFTTAQ